MNHPSRSYVALLRQSRQCIADNSTALTYADLTGDARKLADVQIERNTVLIVRIEQAINKEPTP